MPAQQALLGGAAVLGGALLLAGGGAFLELVGVAAAAQLVSKNFLFAKDHERTTKAFRCAGAGADGNMRIAYRRVVEG